MTAKRESAHSSGSETSSSSRWAIRKAAVESWKPAAELYEGDPAEEEHARQLYERVLEALPDDRDAALRLVALYAQLGEWAKVPEAFAVLVRGGGDPSRAVNLLLELENAGARGPRGRRVGLDGRRGFVAPRSGFDRAGATAEACARARAWLPTRRASRKPRRRFAI